MEAAEWPQGSVLPFVPPELRGVDLLAHTGAGNSPEQFAKRLHVGRVYEDAWVRWAQSQGLAVILGRRPDPSTHSRGSEAVRNQADCWGKAADGSLVRLEVKAVKPFFTGPLDNEYGSFIIDEVGKYERKVPEPGATILVSRKTGLWVWCPRVDRERWRTREVRDRVRCYMAHMYVCDAGVPRSWDTFGQTMMTLLEAGWGHHAL